MKKIFNDSSIAALITVALIMISLGGYLLYSGAKSTIEKQEWKIENLERTIAEQHYEIVTLDPEQLALDVVYIDTKCNTDYFYLLLGKKENPTTTEKFSNNYTEEEFHELIRTFQEDSVKMDLGAALVKECYKNEANNLCVMDAKSKGEVKKVLWSNSHRNKTPHPSPSPSLKTGPNSYNSKEPAKHIESHDSIEAKG